MSAASPALPLSDWGLIRARGVDAAQFLHGQLTQDVQALDSSHAGFSGYCSAKGRLLASFVVWRSGPDELLLACSRDLLEPTLKRLSMFVLRARCRLDDASADWDLFGLAGSSAEEWLGDSAPGLVWGLHAHFAGHVIRLPPAASQARFLLARPSHAGQEYPPAVASSAWLRLEVLSGVIRITQSTVERFVPQMVNLELVGGVSFSKGCYPGQEVVARSQYRGTVKRRAFVLASDSAPYPGAEVFHSADPGQPAGQVALVAPADATESSLALVELKLSALGPGSLHWGVPDGPQLRLVEQPYALASEGTT